MSKRDERVTVEVICVHETEKALIVRRVDSDPKDTVAVPKSLISDSDVNGAGDSGEIEIPMWLALEKELIDDAEA